MPFDLHKLQEFCFAELKRFADEHQEETFYAFAVDAGMLCLNSEEQFERSLQAYRQTWERQTRHIDRWEDLTQIERREIQWLLDMAARLDGLDLSDETACLGVINDERKRRSADENRYLTDEGVKLLRENTGDWAYQGFAQMSNEAGFDVNAYQTHYGLSDNEQKTSEYGLAMDSLVKWLIAADAFACLKRTPDFYATRVEHNY